jgi:hypothetical protein
LVDFSLIFFLTAKPERGVCTFTLSTPSSIQSEKDFEERGHKFISSKWFSQEDTLLLDVMRNVIAMKEKIFNVGSWLLKLFEVLTQSTITTVDKKSNSFFALISQQKKTYTSNFQFILEEMHFHTKNERRIYFRY